MRRNQWSPLEVLEAQVFPLGWRKLQVTSPDLFIGDVRISLGSHRMVATGAPILSLRAVA